MSVASFRLVTLGRLALLDQRGAEEPSLATRRRKLAVLAVLALERRPLARDTLVEMFWGDQDEARARHSLSDALSHLRRMLGPDAITVRRSEVGLATGAPLVVDAAELIDAAAAGQHERVLACHTGPFFNAVYVGGSASFEHWVERTGARIDSLVARARRERCTELARARAWDECALVAGRWLDEEPLSADAALFRLNALKAAGTPDATRAALREFDSLRARVSREFGLAMPDSVTRLADSLRERIPAPDAPPATAPASAVAMEVVGRAPVVAASPPVVTAPAFVGAPPPQRGPQRESRRSTWHAVAWLAGGLAAVLVASTALRLTRGARAELSPTRVAVLPFEVHGGTEVAYLRRGMTDLLSTSLDGAGALRTVDPRIVLGAIASTDSLPFDAARGREIATHVGAGLYVVGEIVQAGDALRLSASLFDARRGAAEATATAVGAPSDLFQLVDRLTAQLLARRDGPPADQLQRIAAVTTSSLPALKAYLQGEDDYRVGRYTVAFEEFQRAVAEDSGFALAHYRLAKTATWAAIWQWDSIVAGSARAVRHENRLSWRARLLVEAFDAWMRGSYDDAERLYRAVVASSPNDVEGWFELGEVLFHCNPLRGRSPTEAREAFEHVLALEPTHRGALVHLIRVAAQQRRIGEVDSLVARAVAVSGEDWALELQLFRASAHHDTATIARLIPRLRTAPDVLLERSVMRVALYLRELGTTERLTALLLEPSRSPELQGEAAVWLADLAVARGRWSEAESHLQRVGRTLPAFALVERTLLATRPFVARPRAELLALRDSVQRWKAAAPRAAWPPVAIYDGAYPLLRLHLLGLLDVRLDSLEAAERAAVALDSAQHAPASFTDANAQRRELARGLAASVRAHLAAARGNHREALLGFERARLHVSEGMLESPVGTQAADRWARAELLRQTGSEEEALTWYSTLPEGGMHGLVYLAPAHLRQAEIHEHRGNRELAARHYARFIELWRDCDPALRPLVTDARDHLRALERTGQ
ncbi:MAG: hypothetical protein ACJ8AD_07705 [Gemmatimonadaceae bacterium]